MLSDLSTLLAQVEEVTEPSLIFNLRNGLLVVAIIAIIVGYKIYQKKSMS